MSTKSRNSGPRKPSRKELLKELELIHASLSSDNADNRTADHAEEHHAVTDTNVASQAHEKVGQKRGSITPQSQSSEPETNTEHDETPGQKTKKEKPVDSLPGQRSLFANNRDASAGTSEEGLALENPFLPQHIKERLEREKSLYQQEIDAAAKIPGLNPYAEKPQIETSLVDELVKIYLPQIEEELRRRLTVSMKNHDE